MTIQSKNVNWRNIYYMLTYAIDELAYLDIDDSSCEKIKSLDDLLAALLTKSVELLYENNFMRDYKPIRVSTDKPKGRILIRESYNKGTIPYSKLYCEYYVINKNTLYNKIIKSAIYHLLQYGKDISKENLYFLYNYFADFHEVDLIEIRELNLNEIDYINAPEYYKPALMASKLVIQDYLARDIIELDEAGNLYGLTDAARLSYIFEKFVRNFYSKEYKKAITTRPSYAITNKRTCILDALLETNTKALIIETKFYESRVSYTSNNINNIREVLDYSIAYKDFNIKKFGSFNRSLTAVVLYAKTGAVDIKDEYSETRILDNAANLNVAIHVKILNLNMSFDEIKNYLIELADTYL